MAISGFGRGRDADTESQAPARPPASGSSSAPGGLTAFIDQGSEFEGKLSFRDTVRIDGRFSGEITSENTLIVGESGEIHANIRSNTIAISGVVVGDVQAGRKVVLHKTARVDGDIEAASLVVEEGAVINGTLKMSGAGASPGSGAKNLKAVPGGSKEAPVEPKKDD